MTSLVFLTSGRHTALISRVTQIAFSFAGRMGTRQEERFDEGLLVIVDPDSGSASLSRVITPRGALGLRTEVLDTSATDLTLRIERIVRVITTRSRGSEDGRCSSCRDNRTPVCQAALCFEWLPEQLPWGFGESLS
jgi:hypothetical protein